MLSMRVLFKEIEGIRVVVCQQTGLHEGVC